MRRGPINWIDAQRYRNDVASGSYRAGRIWLAEGNRGRILACAVWWGFFDGEHPLGLDLLYVDRAVQDRAAVESAGLTDEVETPRYEWPPEDPADVEA